MSRSRRSNAARAAKRTHLARRAGEPAGSSQRPSRGRPKIPPPRDPATPAAGKATGDARSAVAIFDTSVPVYMQTVRETSICPELSPLSSPLRALIVAADVAAADLAAAADRVGAGVSAGPPALDPSFLPGIALPENVPPEAAGEEE
jgi:hypothetical protein